MNSDGSIKAIYECPNSPTYNKAMKDLTYFLWDDDYPLNVKKEYFENFVQKFTTPLFVWYRWKCFESEELEDDRSFTIEKHRNFIKEFKEKSSNFFSFESCDFEWETDCYDQPILFSQLKNFEHSIVENLVKYNFLYERNMSDMFRKFVDQYVFRKELLWFEMNMINFNSYKNLNKITEGLKTYHKLNKTSIFAGKKWISALKETENIEYIVKNIEKQMFLGDKKAWKYYFYFSRKLSLQNLLDARYRYSRIFVDDLKMRKKYRNEIKKAGKHLDNTKWVLDSIKLEYDFGSKKAAMKMIQKYFNQKFVGVVDSINLASTFKENYQILQQHFLIKEKVEKTMIKFEKNNLILSQNFIFPNPIINYICENGNYEITQKLQYSSKKLYILTKKTLCFKLSLTDLYEIEAHDETLFISAQNQAEVNKINNFFIFNTLFVYYEKSCTLSKFIPKISKCTLNFLIIYSQMLTLNEYNFLTISKTIKVIWFNSTTIVRNSVNGFKASLQELMENLPMAENLAFVPSPLLNFDTFNTLQNFKFKVKISNLFISQITEKFEPIDFCDFLKKQSAPSSKISFLYASNEDAEYLLPAVKLMLNTWKQPSRNKPKLFLNEYFMIESNDEN